MQLHSPWCEGREQCAAVNNRGDNRTGQGRTSVSNGQLMKTLVAYAAGALCLDIGLDGLSAQRALHRVLDLPKAQPAGSPRQG